jgi:hypothetical protein
MKVVVRESAEDDLHQIFAWIAEAREVVVLSIVHGARERHS